MGGCSGAGCGLKGVRTQEAVGAGGREEEGMPVQCGAWACIVCQSVW